MDVCGCMCVCDTANVWVIETKIIVVKTTDGGSRNVDLTATLHL